MWHDLLPVLPHKTNEEISDSYLAEISYICFNLLPAILPLRSFLYNIWIVVYNTLYPFHHHPTTPLYAVAL